MKIYLKLLSYPDGAYDESMNGIYLEKENVLIPAIRNESGLFVEDSKYNQKILYDNHFRYVAGTMEFGQGTAKFSIIPPHNSVQLFVDGLEDLTVDLNELGLVPEEVAKNLAGFSKELSSVVEKYFGDNYIKMFVTGHYSHRHSCIIFDMLQDKAGFVRDIVLVDKELGVSRLVCRVMRGNGIALKFKLESKYPIVMAKEKTDIP